MFNCVNRGKVSGVSCKWASLLLWQDGVTLFLWCQFKKVFSVTLTCILTCTGKILCTNLLYCSKPDRAYRIGTGSIRSDATFLNKLPNSSCIYLLSLIFTAVIRSLQDYLHVRSNIARWYKLQWYVSFLINQKGHRLHHCSFSALTSSGSRIKFKALTMSYRVVSSIASTR